MKLLIASDIHGDIECAKKVFGQFKAEGCDKILLLGDLLYHGPRNDLPKNYSPKEVLELLNQNKEYILADYAYLSLDGLSIFATHGHLFNMENPPSLRCGEILLHGHTHILGFTEFGDNNCYINPGSTTIPKENNPQTYMIYENKCFVIKDFYGNEIAKKKF